MSYNPNSTYDELAEIENRVKPSSSSSKYRPDPPGKSSASPTPRVKVSGGPRRGSSIFGEPSAMKPTGPYGRPAYLATSGDELLVDFPLTNSDNEYMSDDDYNSNQNSQSQSSKFRMYDSDTDSEGVVIQNGRPGKPMTSTAPSRLGEAARMAQLLQDSSQLPGGKNHRPLVGGFAAAAYEAAREHHYSSVGKKDPSVIPRDRPAPPSI